MSLIDFYSGAAPDDRGRFLSDIQEWPDDRIESVHDFIQWMFPLVERSGVNFTAPVLDRVAVAEFHARPDLRQTLRKSFLRMLNFYGLEMTNGEVRRAGNFAERARNWLSPGNHNHLRITRILKSLRVLGLESESRALFACLNNIHAEMKDRITDRTFQFWSAANESDYN